MLMMSIITHAHAECYAMPMLLQRTRRERARLLMMLIYYSSVDARRYAEVTCARVARSERRCPAYFTLMPVAVNAPERDDYH